MKMHYHTQLVILIISDCIYLASAALNHQISLEGAYFSMMLSNLFLGPIQFIPAVIMLFWRVPRNDFYKAYIILSVLTILALIAGFSLGQETFDMFTFGFSIQVFSFLLAHYFVYMLHQTAKLMHNKS